MGTLIPLLIDPGQSVYEVEVRRLCALARCDDLVPEYLAARTPLDIVLEQCLWLALRCKPPSMIVRQHARMHGPAGSRRRALPRIHGRHHAAPRR